MRRILRVHRQVMCAFIPALWAAGLLAQDSYRITPDRSTMSIGEWRAFRMVDQYGHAQQKVTWTISDPGSFEFVEGDELHLAARRVGEFRLAARTDYATAEGQISVVEGPTLPPGTKLWTSGEMQGCGTTKLIRAVRVPDGPAFYEQTQCGDGEYIAAYTSRGVQLWRRKISDYGAGGSSSAGNSYDVVGNRLNPHSVSICDSVSPGMPQQTARELLAARNVSFHEQPENGQIWLVEEAGSQCRLWFDEKLTVVKKQKVFTEGFETGGGPVNSAATTRPEAEVNAVAQQAVSNTSQQPPKTAATDAQSQTASTEAPAKPANKPKHVITNDDIKPSPYSGFGGLFYFSSGSINDCDVSCFEQVRMSARLDPEKHPHWREDVLRELDAVRSDGEWQHYLHQVYDAHNAVCELTFDKQDEMRRSGNLRNLDALEVAIADKYDEKMSTAKAVLAVAEAQQATVQKKFEGKPIANAFATVQGTRMKSGFCSTAKVVYPALQ